MTKKSLYGIDENLIFRETFNSYSDLIKNPYIESYNYNLITFHDDNTITIDNTFFAGHFFTKSNFGGNYSLRFKVYWDKTQYQYLIDNRTYSTNYAYLHYVSNIVLTNDVNAEVYVNGVKTTNLGDVGWKDIVITNFKIDTKETNFLGMAGNSKVFSFIGKIKLLEVYNRTLTDDEVSALYKNTLNMEPGIKTKKLHYNSSKGIQEELTGLQDMTLNGTEVIIDKDYVTKFNGSSDKINFADDSSLHNSTCTFSCWFKILEDGNHSICFKRITGTEYAQHAIVINSGNLYFLQSSVAGTWNTLLLTSFSDVGNWNHVVCTNDGTEAKIYLNGELKVTDNTPATSLASSSEPLTIGFGRISSTDNYLNGLINDFKFYTTAFNSEQVSRDYNATKWRYK